MARLIKKRNSSTQYFLAILKVESDSISLNAMDTKDNSNPDKEIDSIKTDFDFDFLIFNQKVRELFARHKILLQSPAELPPRRLDCDHEIPLVDDAKVFAAKVYHMPISELEELRKQHDLSKHWIRPSTSNFAAPVLFARKANGSLRMCKYYRGLNRYTKCFEFPLPNIDTL